MKWKSLAELEKRNAELGENIEFTCKLKIHNYDYSFHALWGKFKKKTLK